jgi:WD40 repeat protein
MRKFLYLLVTVVILLSCNNAKAQLIGEGDTLWYKNLKPNEVKQVQFMPDGRKLGVVLNDNEIRMYDAITGDSLWSKLFDLRIFSFSITSGGNTLIVNNSRDTLIHELDINTGEIIQNYKYINIHKDFDYYLAYATKNPDLWIIANRVNDFAIYNNKLQKIMTESIGSNTSVMYACPYSEYFIKAEGYIINQVGKVRLSLYDVNTLNSVALLEEIDASLDFGGDIKISYDGKYAATDFGTGALKIWDLENKKLLKQYWPTFRNGVFTGGGPQFGLSFLHNSEMIVNCGGYTTPDSKGVATTITNFINDKRAVIYPDGTTSYCSDVDINDKYLVCGADFNLLIVKLKIDAVPVEENQKTIITTLYPNPATGTINILIPENFGIIERIEIIDNYGSIIRLIDSKNTKLNDNNLTLNVSDLQNGSYFLRISNAANSKTYKLIVKR